MRTISVLRSVVLAAALAAPLAQAALADQPEQQAMAARSTAHTTFYDAGPYSNQLTAPAVGSGS